MRPSQLKVRLIPFLQRGRTIALASRALAVVLCLIWSLRVAPTHPARLPLVVIAGYALFAVLVWLRRAPVGRMGVVHDLVDALAAGGVAASTGGVASPLWLLLYPHVVAVSVRRGFAYALGIGLFDGALVLTLAGQSGWPPFAIFHAAVLLWCSFMGGATSAVIHRTRARLGSLNEELTAKNEALATTLAAHDAAQREQAQALGRLKGSEEGYRRLLERIQDGVLIVGEGGLIAYANQVFASMVGEPPAALAGRDFRDLAVPEDRADLSERYARWHHLPEASGSLETRLRARQGAVRLVSLRAGSLEFEGQPAIITTIRDITRERQLEQDLKGHAERLAAINEIANAVNQRLEIDDVFDVAAQEARRLVAFDCLTILLVEGPEVEVVAVGANRSHQRTRLPRERVEWTLKRPNLWCEGSGPRPERVETVLANAGVLATATLPLHSKGRVIGSLNLGRDRMQPFSSWELAVLEPVGRHLAIALDNARLFEAATGRGQELESLLEIVKGVAARLDLSELLPVVTRSVNRIMKTQHCVLLLRSGDTLTLAAQEGLEPEVVDAIDGMEVGDSLSGWVAREGLPLALYDMKDDPRLALRDAVERFGYRSYFCVPLRLGNEILGTLEVVTKVPRRFSPEEQDLMTLFAGQASVAIGNARLFEEARRHLTQVKEANRRLEDLDRLRQEYLRNVSHEFRSPLTVIQGFVEYLLGATNEAPLQGPLRAIRTSADRLIDLVDTLIEMSRIEQGPGLESLRIEALDLRGLVTASLDAFHAAAAARDIDLSLDLPAEALRLEGDAGLLHQIVRKLVDNALKYSAPGGKVVVRGRDDGESLVLEVEDDGIGIADEHVPRIFEKFYVVDGGIARRTGGVGLGLYLVREIVRLHRGTVEVRSRPGRGSVFSIRLPRTFQASAGQPVVA